jgi:hypothetical protein
VNHAMQADIGYKSDLLHCTDQMLVAMAREKNEAAIRTLVRRHNQPVPLCVATPKRRTWFRPPM